MSKVNLSRQTIKLYWQASRGFRKLGFINLLLAATAVISGQVLLNAVFAEVLNKISAGHREISTFMPLIAIYITLALIELVAWRLSVWFIWEFELRLGKALQEKIFDYLSRQTQDFHNNRFAGWLVSQSGKFVRASERMYDIFTFDVVTGVTFLVASLGFMFYNLPIYAVFVCVFLAFFIFVAYKLIAKQRPYNIAEAESESQVTARIADVLANISAVISFGHKKQEQAAYIKKVDHLVSTSRTLRDVTVKTDTWINIFTTTLAISAVIGAIVAYTQYGIAVGTAYLIVSYTLNIVRRMWDISKIMRNFNRLFGDAHAMTDILLTEPIAIIDHPNAAKLKVPVGEISLKDVSFAYENDSSKVFTNFSLDIKAGERVGLVGHSGSGKTTLSKLVLRLYDIKAGVITVDSQDISKVTMESLRKSISYVPQEPLLFHRSLAENISYGKVKASQREIEAAAKLAHAHEFIKDLPEGYETLVGERGVKLSGGQRQRVAIARAILKDSPILVLDEATSALDSESEKLIQDALGKLMEGRTTIVIAHRLSTIQKMDRIIVLDKGKIAEQGSHKQLLAKKGTYARLWAHQSGGFIEE